MQAFKTISLLILLGLVKSTLTVSPPLSVTSSPGRASLIRTAQGSLLPAVVNVSGPATSLSDYPVDPYQMRVPDTTTSLIFSKYGPPIHFQTFLELIGKAQYQLVQGVIAARGDGPVPQTKFEWSEKKLYISISRPLAQEDLTWLMLADTLEGLRLFFDGLQGWFELSVTILDDIAGPVGEGSVSFW